MPRSFLVKKHQSSKKTDYGRLSSQTEEAAYIPHKEHPQHSYLPPCHHCPASSLCHQHSTQPPLPLTAERLHPPPSPKKSPHSFPGYSSETNRTSLTDTYKPEEPRTTVNLEIHHVAGDFRRRESLLPPSLPVLTLFPAVSPSSSSSRGNFECLDCHEEHLSFPGLTKHRKLQCDWSSKKSFSCKYCEKEYVSLGALKMHIRTHTLPCVCKLCGKAFSRPWLLQGHIRTHTGEKPFSCFHCSRAFADRSNLRAHLQTHAEVKKYQCVSCFKTFSRISLLAKHQEAGCPLS